MKKFFAISTIGLVVTFVVAAMLWSYVMEEFGVMVVLLGIPGSLIVAWSMSHSTNRQQQNNRRTKQNGEAGMGGGDRPPTSKVGGKTVLPKTLLNSWVLGVILWILTLAAYIYYGYYWADMPLWLGIFTLLAIPMPQAVAEMRRPKGTAKNTSWITGTLDLLGAGKAWRGTLVLVVLVAESMLYWYYLLPSIPTVGFYLLLLVATILVARRMVVEESHVKGDVKGGDDKQPDGGRKSDEPIGKPPGAD